MSAMTKVRPLLWERCQGRCEVSNLPLDYDTFDAHHRRPKGMGGSAKADRDSIANLLALDPAVHNPGPWSVHGNPDWSRPRGYLLRKSWDVMRPVLLRGHRWVLLGKDGRYYGVHPRLIGVLDAAL